MHSTQTRFHQPLNPAFQISDLKRGAVHVWHLGLDVAESLGEIGVLPLNEAERTQADRISREPIRRRFVVSRVLLKSILGRYLGVSPVAVAFEWGEHGKPRLAGTPSDCGLVFNMSHSDDQLAVALAFEARLGVDIEFWRPLDDCSALAYRCFAPVELEHWEGLPEQQRLPAFFRLWTLKEALCKAVGRGLALGLQGCVFDCSPPRPRLLGWPGAEAEPTRRWYFHEISDLRHTSGAVASDRLPTVVRRFDATSL